MSPAGRPSAGPLTLRMASLVVLRRDDELVELLRRRERGPEEDRVARLFNALLAEVDSGQTAARHHAGRAWRVLTAPDVRVLAPSSMKVHPADET